MNKKLLNVVLDTNIILSSRSKNVNSPNIEIVELWKSDKFILLFSDDILIEYIEKLTEKWMSENDIIDFVDSVLNMGDFIEIKLFHIHIYPKDQDDIAFILCAENGKADYLISYDNHLLVLNWIYSFKIVIPLNFLSEFRTLWNKSKS